MSKGLTITPYGGLGEIGMNCMLIETAQSAMLIDCGLMFSDLDHFGVQVVVPNFSHLLTKKDKIKGIFCTHGHEDHIGALSFAFKAGIRAPIYSSHFTHLMIRERLKDSGVLDAAKLEIVNPGSSVKIGDFTVTPATVNHSIVDSYALFIDTPIGKIVHTGDFKGDPSPHLGDVMEWKEFQKAGDEGVLLLMSDSTNVEREDPALLDTEIVKNLEAVFKKAEGMIVVSMFSSNIGRLANILKLANQMGRKVAFSGRSMQQNVRLAHERGIFDVEKLNIIPIEEVNQYDRNKLLVFSTGCQGEPRSALNRMAHGEHAQLDLGQGDTVILSSSQIPGNELSISSILDKLFMTGADVLYDAIEDVHTSGHATRPELKKMLETVRPKFFIPVHGQYRHLAHHADLAHECGVLEENIFLAKNGEVIELTPDRIRMIDEVTELRILVSDREGTEITRDLLKDRRRLAETGVVFCLLSREKDSGRILSKPEVISKGLVAESFESWMMEEAVKVVEDEILEYKKGIKKGFIDPDLDENIRIQLRRFFFRNIGKKPTVIPMILDV